MRRFTQTEYFVVYLLIAFFAYLLMSAVIALIGGFTYRSVLSAEGQLIGVILYLSAPVPTMIDMDAHNERYDRKYGRV